MRTFRHSFQVNAEISRVWQFYTDIKHLEVITPPRLQLRILKSTHQHLVEGSEVWLAGKLVIKSEWHSRITSLKPYEYVDEMISGRFKVWMHTHKFRFTDNKKTEVVDEIIFELPYGFIGRVFEGYVLKRLDQTFSHREEATKSELGRA